jgi:hypothetical protein
MIIFNGGSGGESERKNHHKITFEVFYAMEKKDNIN